jgi:hypothetical protein
MKHCSVEILCLLNEIIINEILSQPKGKSTLDKLENTVEIISSLEPEITIK